MEFRRLPAIEHLRCTKTGLEWYEPAIAAGGGDLYQQLETKHWYYMADKWEFQAALDVLRPGDKVLEVGVGFGHFLRAARSIGCEISGVELNPSAVAAAQAAGFTIFAEDLAAVAVRKASQLDAACAFQVLEHVPEPLPFLRSIIDLVRPGGKIILSVPDATFMRSINPSRVELLDQPPHHMTHWDEDVFRALEQLLPIKLIKVRREPLQKYHVDWFVNSWSKRARQTFGPTLSRALVSYKAVRAFSGALNLGLRRFVNGHTLFVIFHKL